MDKTFACTRRTRWCNTCTPDATGECPAARPLDWPPLEGSIDDLAGELGAVEGPCSSLVIGVLCVVFFVFGLATGWAVWGAL